MMMMITMTTISRAGQVENLMVSVTGGQVYSGMMGVHQNMELGTVIIQEISAKVDIKIEKRTSSLRHSSSVYLDPVECNISRNEIHLISSALQNNLLKIKMDIGIHSKTDPPFSYLKKKPIISGKILCLLPAKILPDETETETLLGQDKMFQGKLMVERVSFNLKVSREYDSDEEERPTSPSQDSEILYAIHLYVSQMKGEVLKERGKQMMFKPTVIC